MEPNAEEISITIPTPEVDEDFTWLTERLDAQNLGITNLSSLVSQVLTKIETNPNAELLTAMEAMRTLQAQTMEALTMTQNQLQQMSELVTSKLIPANLTTLSPPIEPQPEPVTITVVEPESVSLEQTPEQSAVAEQKRRRRL